MTLLSGVDDGETVVTSRRQRAFDDAHFFD